MNYKKITQDLSSEINIHTDDEGYKIIVIWDYCEFKRAIDKVQKIYNINSLNYETFYKDVEKETDDIVGFISWFN